MVGLDDFTLHWHVYDIGGRFKNFNLWFIVDFNHFTLLEWDVKDLL